MEEVILSERSAIEDPGWVWNQFLDGPHRSVLSKALGRAIVTRRWFGSKTRTVRSTEIINAVTLSQGFCLLLMEIGFADGGTEIYQVPLALAAASEAERLLRESSPAVLLHVRQEDGAAGAVLYDALHDAAFCARLLEWIGAADRQEMIRGGHVATWRAKPLVSLLDDQATSLRPQLVRAEQSNSSVIYGDRLILKLFRRVEQGRSPDLEIGACLTERGFPYVPPLVGTIEYRPPGQEPWTLAMLQSFVPNQGDAWQYTLERLTPFLEGRRNAAADVIPIPAEGFVRAAEQLIPEPIRERLGQFLADAAQLGAATAQLHLTMAAESNVDALNPEALTPDDQKAMHARSCELAGEVFALLKQHWPSLPEEIKPRAREVLQLEARVSARLARLIEKPLSVSKIRVHGDYHLGQVLVSQGEFFIIDFEGEPARALAQRRQKQTAMRDVAGMIRSFHYASCAAAPLASQGKSAEEARAIVRWAEGWYFWTSTSFLSTYLQTAAGSAFVPSERSELECLLDACLLEKALYELRYELNNRPDWVYLPLEALIALAG